MNETIFRTGIRWDGDGRRSGFMIFVRGFVGWDGVSYGGGLEEG